ncbi:hypothetical protein SUGI_0080420 [Cryptomeria japonica]|nr:hypothetical protein SUGI_0080420 [Cryptomeria japonica]
MYHNLQNKGFKVFLDQKSLQGGDYIPGVIRHAICRASVHLLIFSRNYVESEWCLDELNLMFRNGAPIVPVFWEIRPSNVRMEGDKGVYAKDFKTHKRAGKFGARSLEKWKTALRWASLLEGFIYDG